MTKWYEYPVGVPFGNRNYDVALGGSHDLTLLCPPNTPVTSILTGVVSDISSPSWGKQVCITMDEPEKGHPTFAYLHLAATNPQLLVGDKIGLEDSIGWSGGCTDASQYVGRTNPTGQNFLNSVAMSSQPQVGIALCDGSGYGYKGWSDWTNGKSMDLSLDPLPVLKKYLNPVRGESGTNAQRKQFERQWRSVIADGDPSTGIAGVIYALYLSGKDPGPPLTPELANIDWNGKQHLFQVFPSGMAYWYPDGHHEWHQFM